MNYFEHNSVKYTLQERTNHREKGGGFEKWSFEVNNKKYFLYGDIRYIKSLNEYALYADFYSEKSLMSDTKNVWDFTEEVGYDATLVLNSLAELIKKLSLQTTPPATDRPYRYVVFTTPAEWESVIQALISKYGTYVTDNHIIQCVEEFLNWDLSVQIDAGYFFCHVCDTLR